MRRCLVSSDDNEELMRIIAEVRRARRESREQYLRQQLMIDFVAAALWIAFGLYVFQGSMR